MVLMTPNLVNLAVNVEVLNAMLLPIVLGFLLALEARVLPPEDRIRGYHRTWVWASSAIVCGLGLYTAAAWL